MDSIGETVPNGKLRVMIETVCDVLKGVHEVGLIHRDISPDNIFMCRDGAFKLIDFGSVKQGLSDNNLSSTIILKHGQTFIPSALLSTDWLQAYFCRNQWRE